MNKKKKALIIAGISMFSLGILVAVFMINPYAPMVGGFGGLLYLLMNIKIK